MRFVRILAPVCIAIGVLPVLSTLAAFSLAGLLGCQLDEGSVHACRLFGADIGDLLYTMGMMFWLAFVTLPLAVAGAVIWALAEIITWVRRGRT